MANQTIPRKPRAVTAPGGARKTAAPASLTDTAVDVIRNRILDLTLPPSTRIDETMLAERFALSRTPAREALNRLVAEGLVLMQHNRGAIVSPLDINNVRDLFNAYFACERMVGFFCDTKSPGLVDDLRRTDRAYVDQLASRDFLELTKINAAFHARIAQATGNPYITDFARRLQNQSRRISYYIFIWDEDADRYSVHQKKVVSDHHDIIAAVEQGDNAQLVEHLTRHTRLFQQRILQVMDASRAADVPLPISFE